MFVRRTSVPDSGYTRGGRQNGHHLKWAKALFASAILCVSSFFLMLGPRCGREHQLVGEPFRHGFFRAARA